METITLHVRLLDHSTHSVMLVTGKMGWSVGTECICISLICIHVASYSLMPAYSWSNWGRKTCRNSFLLAFRVGVSKPFSTEKSSGWIKMAFTLKGKYMKATCLVTGMGCVGTLHKYTCCTKTSPGATDIKTWPDIFWHNVLCQHAQTINLIILII